MAILSSEKYGKPGDLIIKDIVLTSKSGLNISIWALIYSVELYEDLYSNSLSGSLSFGDSLALSRHLPLNGDEKLKLSFYTPGQDDQPKNEIQLNMRVYKTSQRIEMGTDTAVLVGLEFVSEEFFLNPSIKFSKSFSKMPYSKMAEKIYTEFLVSAAEQRSDLNSGEVYAMPTDSPRSVIIPYWSPFYAINWLANKASAQENSAMSDYMFYQSLDGSYWFMPISHFKDKPVQAKYKHRPPDQSRDAEEFNNITDLSYISTGNRLQDIGSGVFSSIQETFDIHNKKLEATAYRYTKNFTDVNHVDEYPLIPATLDHYSDKLMSYRKVLPKNSYKINDVKDNETHNLYSLSRQSLMNQMNTIILQITVPGDSRRRVGDIIELDIISQENTAKKDDPLDPYISGRYMVTKINHSFGHGDYELVMTIAKDSYGTAVPDKKDPELSA